MRFAGVVGGAADTGEIKSAIATCQDKITSILIELSTSYDNRSPGSTGLGGDIAILHLIHGVAVYADISSFTLKKFEAEQDALIKKLKTDGLSDAEKEEIIKHLKALDIAIAQCQANGIFTAATDGKTMWLSVEFCNKLSKLGLRFVIAHEATHIQYNHPAQRGARDPSLYNIAIDLKNNYFQILDANTRLQNKTNAALTKDGSELFRTNLGEFITFNEYKAFLADPFNPPKKLAHLSPIHAMKQKVDSTYVNPGKDIAPMYFAEPSLADDMKRPANIYDALYAAVPKCKECGKWAVYEKPKEVQEIEKKLKIKKRGPCCIDHKHNGEDCCTHKHDPKICPFNSPDHCSNCGCSKCDQSDGGGMPLDVIGMAGSLLDKHMDNQLTEDEIEKKLREASNLAKQYGYGSGFFADTLAQLSKPKMNYKDFIRFLIQRKSQSGESKPNWNKPRIKPLLAGLYMPRKHDINFNILLLIDCSGSMSNDDIALGVSQFQCLGTQAAIWAVPFDVSCYWDQMVSIKKADAANLHKINVMGRGGTDLTRAFAEWEANVKQPIDLIAVVSDTFVGDHEVNNAKEPPKGTHTLWIQTAQNDSFKPRFGRVFNLRGER